MILRQSCQSEDVFSFQTRSTPYLEISHQPACSRLNMPTSPDKLSKSPITSSPVGSWLLTNPRSVTLCTLLAVAAASAHLLVRSLEAYQQNSIKIVEEGTEAIVIFEFIRKSYFLCLWLLLPALTLHLIRARREGPPFKGILMASLAAFAGWIATEITKAGASQLQLAGVEPSAINSVFRLIPGAGIGVGVIVVTVLGESIAIAIRIHHGWVYPTLDEDSRV